MLVANRIVPTLARSTQPRFDRADSSAYPVSVGRSRQIESIAAFLRDTSAHDRYWRFGNAGSESVNWLIERMQTDLSRGPYVAESGGQLIGLLDFFTMNEEMEFGVLVYSSRRRQGIGGSLVRSFLDGVARSQPDARIIAYCDFENRAALGLLQASGLQATRLDRDWAPLKSSYLRRSAHAGPMFTPASIDRQGCDDLRIRAGSF